MRTPSRTVSGKDSSLSAKDFREHLIREATQIAPRDVESLVDTQEAITAKIARGCGGHELLETQLRFALELVTDHIEGRSPQIPYHTVSLLTVALLYFMNPIDVIPDMLPRVGSSDDALMCEMAFELAAKGVERYATWKGVPPSMVLPQQVTAVPQTVKRSRPARRSR